MGKPQKIAGPNAQPRPDPATVRRLIFKTTLVDGCWLFTGYCDSKGYGQLWYQGRARWAHRISYAAFNGPIPDGLTVDHTCHNPSCVNPEHLRLATMAENTAEGNGRRSKTK